MKALVTGGAGFIGSHLVEHLLGHADVTGVRVVDNFSTGRWENLAPLLSRVDLLEGDLLDDEVRERAVAGMDVIFHEAALPSVPRSVAEPVHSHLHGAHATVLLLESARKAGVRRLVLAASSSAYGDTAQLPKHEEMPVNPLSPYAASKVACEAYARAYARCYPLDTVSLRYFNIFGPRQDPSSPYSGVIARFCRAYCQGDRPVIFGDGQQSRDFTYIVNAVSANLLAARHPDRFDGAVLNVGSGEQTTLNTLVHLLNEITGQERQPEYREPRSGDVRHSLADIRRAREVLGYRPAILVREGLGRTLEWYRQDSARQSWPATDGKAAVQE